MDQTSNNNIKNNSRVMETQASQGSDINVMVNSSEPPTLNSPTRVLVRHLSNSKSWRDIYNEDIEVFVQQFPKIELHVHLDGSFDPDVLWDYIQSHQPESWQTLPTESVLPWEPGKTLAVQRLVRSCPSAREYHNLCTCRGYRSLKQMLTCFEIFLPTVRQNLDLIEHLAFDFCQRQWQQHVIYTEVRYSPFLLAEGYTENQGNASSSSSNNNPNITGEDVYRCVTRGLRRGCQTFGIVVNQILSCITWRPDWAEPTLQLVQKYRTDFPCAAVGLDIAAGEEHFDSQLFPHLSHFEVFQKARAANIPITLHAGEVATHQVGAQNIRRAVQEYGAQRIGHGYRVVHDPVLMEEMRRQKIHFEVCPTSSLETGGWILEDEEEEEEEEENTTSTTEESVSLTSKNEVDYSNGNRTADSKEIIGTMPNTEQATTKKSFFPKKDWKKHPCRIMQAHGLSVSINSDDPAVFHTSLTWQYRTALVKMGLSRYDLYQTNLQAIDAAFLSPTQKQALRDQIEHFGKMAGIVNEFGHPLDGGPPDVWSSTTRERSSKEPLHSLDSSVSNTSSNATSNNNDNNNNTGGSVLYRRSLSENFKDRVYFQAKLAMVVAQNEEVEQEPPEQQHDQSAAASAVPEEIVQVYI